jgi:hypothetical protein
MPQQKRRFNTAGPCDPRWHYLLPPLPRVPSAWRHAEAGDYFVLHAPRQSGKTTFLRAFARALTESGRCVGLYSSCEAAEAKGDDDVAAQDLLVARLEDRIVEQLPEDLRPPPFVVGSAQSRLRDFLAHWATHSPRPVVLLLDEIDAVRGNSLISVLRQLREAFPERPQRAPWSVVLCGLRDVREYKAASGGDGARLGTASPFNIKVASLTLAAFTPEEIATLLAQHTTETGQAFEPADVCIVPKNNFVRLQQLGQQIADHRGHPIHRQRLNLNYERRAESVHHQARQFVRLRPHQPPRRSRRPPPDRPHQRRANPRGIKRDPIPAQPPPHDLGLAVINARPDEAPGAVPTLDRGAVMVRRNQRLDFVHKHPWMTLHHPGLDVGLELEKWRRRGSGGGNGGGRDGGLGRDHVATTVRSSGAEATATVASAAFGFGSPTNTLSWACTRTKNSGVSSPLGTS